MKKSVLLGVAVVTTIFACTKKSAKPDANIKPQESTNFSQYAVMGLDSPFLSIDTANVMINSYLNSISSDANAIRSIIVDADALRYYLQNTSIKRVKLMFAHKLSWVRGGNANQHAGFRPDGLTIVIAGFDSNNNYIYSPQGAVMDFGMPCPNHCPDNGTAASHLLPTSQ